MQPGTCNHWCTLYRSGHILQGDEHLAPSCRWTITDLCYIILHAKHCDWKCTEHMILAWTLHAHAIVFLVTSWKVQRVGYGHNLYMNDGHSQTKGVDVPLPVTRQSKEDNILGYE